MRSMIYLAALCFSAPTLAQTPPNQWQHVCTLPVGCTNNLAQTTVTVVSINSKAHLFTAVCPANIGGYERRSFEVVLPFWTFGEGVKLRPSVGNQNFECESLLFGAHSQWPVKRWRSER